MKLYEAERYLKKQLASIYEDAEAANITALALEHLTGFTRSEQLMKKEEMLTKEQSRLLEQAAGRLLQHEPIQYLMQKAWFYGLELYVDQDVLIPRPETEELVDWIIKDTRQSKPEVFDKQSTGADLTTNLKILDAGTGSGCIALALKKNMPRAEVWGCDISDRALNVARRNGSELNIRVDFQSVDFLDLAQQKHLPSVDILVSNPPYIPKKDKAQMRPNVLNYEPHTALFVPDEDPLLFYKALLAFCGHRLHDNGLVYMELHEGLAAPVRTLFNEAGFSAELRQDMQGKNRMLKAGRISDL